MQVLKEELGGKLAMDLFSWWEISISWSIVFLMVTGFILYVRSRPNRKKEQHEENKQKMNYADPIGGKADNVQFRARAASIAKDFIFVWVLLGLLVFYIFSVKLGTGALSETVFAVGNVIVEVFLGFYLLRNRDKIRAKGRKEPKQA
jgi:Na+/melibiose symporter-like transporter